MYTPKEQKFLIYLYQIIFRESHDTTIVDGSPALMCLRDHINNANNLLNKPFTPTKMPRLMNKIEIILNQYYTDNKPYMSIAMGIDIMMENDIIDVMFLSHY